MARKPKKTKPKPRGVWKINPKTRVKESAKIYRRSKEKKKKKSWVDEIGWFGEKQK